jgi:raw score 2.70
MRILLFLAHFAMLLFSAYFYFNFDVRWVQVIGYNLAFNEPVANSLNHSINIYFKLIAITTFSYLFFAIFQRFCRSFALLLWMAKVGVFGKYLFALNALQSTDYDGIFQTSSVYIYFLCPLLLSLLSYLYCKK